MCCAISEPGVTDLPATADAAVIGGGIVGIAIARGLLGHGLRTVILDEGDRAHRASRANFALIWVQGKGLGMSAYASWSKRSADHWRQFADGLEDEAGIDLALSQPGGFNLAFSDEELQRLSERMKRLHNQQAADFRYETLDRRQTQAMLPAIGPDVVGSVFSPHDGHVNSLRLFRALHAACDRRGGTYIADAKVARIVPLASGFRIETSGGTIETAKVVLTAGLGNAALAPMAGLSAPVRPLRGQIVVTERIERFLDYPINWLRQTDEGTVMIGDSQDESGEDGETDLAINATMAQRAVRAFPMLAAARVVRSWSGLRVMTTDGFPIYDQSRQHPGAFIATCHSGVTLAANHAGLVADAIAAGRLPEALRPFSARRFDVHAAG
jgi:hydrogen cyanide synthase HcnC